MDHYFAKRDQTQFREKRQEKSQKAGLLRRQMGLCAHYEQPLTVETGYHVHDVPPRSTGGTDKDANLELIHPVWHEAIMPTIQPLGRLPVDPTQHWRLTKT